MMKMTKIEKLLDEMKRSNIEYWNPLIFSAYGEDGESICEIDARYAGGADLTFSFDSKSYRKKTKNDVSEDDFAGMLSSIMEHIIMEYELDPVLYEEYEGTYRIVIYVDPVTYEEIILSGANTINDTI